MESSIEINREHDKRRTRSSTNTKTLIIRLHEDVDGYEIYNNNNKQ